MHGECAFATPSNLSSPLRSDDDLDRADRLRFALIGAVVQRLSELGIAVQAAAAGGAATP